MQTSHSTKFFINGILAWDHITCNHFRAISRGEDQQMDVMRGCDLSCGLTLVLASGPSDITPMNTSCLVQSEFAARGKGLHEGPNGTPRHHQNVRLCLARSRRRSHRPQQLDHPPHTRYSKSHSYAETCTNTETGCNSSNTRSFPSH
eukprot:1009866-Amphidinium_carterae.1